MPHSDRGHDRPHGWRTVSRHLTSEGQVRYERCRCGRWRVMLDVPSAAAEVDVRNCPPSLPVDHRAGDPLRVTPPSSPH